MWLHLDQKELEQYRLLEDSVLVHFLPPITLKKNVGGIGLRGPPYLKAGGGSLQVDHNDITYSSNHGHTLNVAT